MKKLVKITLSAAMAVATAVMLSGCININAITFLLNP